MLWSKQLETGNENVDNQHKEIFRLVQHVLDADTFDNRKEKIETAMGFLSEYAVRHFATEEALMRESNYPLYEQHKGLHDEFVKQVVAFMAKFKESGDLLSVEETINNFVVKWLNEHILEKDKEMAKFYKNWSSEN